jgi:hypothetical protein
MTRPQINRLYVATKKAITGFKLKILWISTRYNLNTIVIFFTDSFFTNNYTAMSCAARIPPKGCYH